MDRAVTPAPPPDLSDPAARAAYRRELRMVARPVRRIGVALAVAGALLAAARARLWPHLPIVLPLALLGLAALHMLAAVAVRAKYHRARMDG